jgi:hypothetical protein
MGSKEAGLSPTGLPRGYDELFFSTQLAGFRFERRDDECSSSP